MSRQWRQSEISCHMRFRFLVDYVTPVPKAKSTTTNAPRLSRAAMILKASPVVDSGGYLVCFGFQEHTVSGGPSI